MGETRCIMYVVRFGFTFRQLEVELQLENAALLKVKLDRTERNALF